jgi:hypothetical protein
MRDSVNFLGFVSGRKKAGSLYGLSQNSLIHRLSEMGPVATLVDSDRLKLRRPFERQIDPVEQGLGTQLSWLSSLADCFNDCGCYES